MQMDKNSNDNLMKKNKMRRLALLDIEIYYKVIVIKVMFYQCKVKTNRPISHDRSRSTQ